MLMRQFSITLAKIHFTSEILKPGSLMRAQLPKLSTVIWRLPQRIQFQKALLFTEEFPYNPVMAILRLLKG